MEREAELEPIFRGSLKSLLEKGSDEDLVREMTAFVAHRLMDLEVEGLNQCRPRRAQP